MTSCTASASPGLDSVLPTTSHETPPNSPRCLLRLLKGLDHALQPLALAFERGDPGTGMLGLIESLRVQGGAAPAALEPQR